MALGLVVIGFVIGTLSAVGAYALTHSVILCLIAFSVGGAAGLLTIAALMVFGTSETQHADISMQGSPAE